ncbi:MAG: hypothetical protein ACLR3C_09870 [Eggerthella lenta]
MRALVPRFGQQAALAAARLHDLSPLAVLGAATPSRARKTAPWSRAWRPRRLARRGRRRRGRRARLPVEQARRVDTEIIDWEDAS